MLRRKKLACDASFAGRAGLRCGHTRTAATNGDFLCSVKTVTATVPSASDRDQSACDGRNCSNTKHEMRDTSTATPSLLTADSQVRSQSSISSAHCGPIMWVLGLRFRPLQSIGCIDVFGRVRNGARKWSDGEAVLVAPANFPDCCARAPSCHETAAPAKQAEHIPASHGAAPSSRSADGTFGLVGDQGPVRGS